MKWSLGLFIAGSLAVVAVRTVTLYHHSSVSTTIVSKANSMALEEYDAEEDSDEGGISGEAIPSFDKAAMSLVTEHCLPCHGRTRARGRIILEGLGAHPSQEELMVWQKAVGAVRAGRMPPAGKPPLGSAAVHDFVRWVGAASNGTGASPIEDATHVTRRRLNRAEYNNTIRDLTGLDIRPADDFPSDDVGYGFDNIGDVLSISPLLAERYVDAAEKVIERMFASPALRRLMDAPAQDLLPYGLRGLLPVRDQQNKILHLGPPPSVDSRELELGRAASILRAFVDRAYRRPITYHELDRLVGFVDSSLRAGEGIEPGLKRALQAVLASPLFLFHLEGCWVGADSQAPRPLNDFALASRLSYFLWSSMPDETLYHLASTGKLREPRTLRAQARRMLRDERARALVDNFAEQWLGLRNLKDFSPDPARFPEFDEELRAAAKTETELFCQNIIQEDRSILEFLDADYTFVNERLARHYGLPAPHGSEFQRVSLTGSNRGGVLTQSSILAVTSNPTRTSPVKRGRWILENLLAAPIPSPPPGTDDLKQHQSEPGTLRQRLERHRADPKCTSCHERMDPLGFGLENFDAVGAWRDRDGNQPIDASGSLAGRSFGGPNELRALLRSRREDFVHCLSEKLLSYSLGRGLAPSDWGAVDAIVRRLERHGDRFSSLIVGIVLSKPFRQDPPQ
jgi:Protein of unknown function (DUF1592)/Protein of unknown function (DUF1588)/Protein of unknown function (DUF1587)/Protein of unknown function (DUF1585)/Protein of unknown function (DUF1595)